MASPFSIPAIGGISDPEEVRVVLFVNGQFVHVPLKQLLKELDADNLASGTVPNARVSDTLTADKAYRRGNILGTVSQSSGVPTGALIENGSNANGNYVRFADGLQICWGGVLITPVANELTLVPVTFPSAFSAPPEVWTTHNSGSNAPRTSQYANITATSVNIGLFRTNTTTTGVSWLAMGRWF